MVSLKSHLFPTVKAPWAKSLFFYSTLSILQKTFSKTGEAEYLNLPFLQVSELYYEESQSAVSKDDFCYC